MVLDALATAPLEDSATLTPPGMAVGVTAFELADHALVPTLLVVLTRQV